MLKTCCNNIITKFKRTKDFKKISLNNMRINLIFSNWSDSTGVPHSFQNNFRHIGIFADSIMYSQNFLF